MGLDEDARRPRQLDPAQARRAARPTQPDQHDPRCRLPARARLPRGSGRVTSCVGGSSSRSSRSRWPPSVPSSSRRRWRSGAAPDAATASTSSATPPSWPARSRPSVRSMSPSSSISSVPIANSGCTTTPSDSSTVSVRGHRTRSRRRGARRPVRRGMVGRQPRRRGAGAEQHDRVTQRGADRGTGVGEPDPHRAFAGAAGPDRGGDRRHGSDDRRAADPPARPSRRASHEVGDPRRRRTRAAPHHGDHRTRRAARRAGRRAWTRVDAALSRERSFSSHVSHQLRTPVAALRAAIETELAAPRPDPTSLLHEGLGAVDRLEATITSLLALARRAEGEPVLCDAAAVVADQVDRWRPTLAAHGRDIGVVGAPLIISIDPATVRHIVDVLIENVFRHGAGMIAVRIERSQTQETGRRDLVDRRERRRLGPAGGRSLHGTAGGLRTRDRAAPGAHARRVERRMSRPAGVVTDPLPAPPARTRWRLPDVDLRLTCRCSDRSARSGHASLQRRVCRSRTWTVGPRPTIHRTVTTRCPARRGLRCTGARAGSRRFPGCRRGRCPRRRLARAHHPVPDGRDAGRFHGEGRPRRHQRRRGTGRPRPSATCPTDGRRRCAAVGS